MSIETTPYLLNTETGRVFNANEALRKYARDAKHIVPCDEHGNRTGTADGAGQEAELQARVDQLERENKDLHTENELLKAEIGNRPKAHPDSVKLESGEEAEEPDQGGTDINRMDLIVQAIGELEQGNPDHFTKTDNVPRVDYLRTQCVLDPQIKLEERDEAWRRYNDGS